MYPGFMPNVGMSSVAPLANGLASAGNAANAAGTAKAAGKLGTSLFGKINWASLLSNTQKTLNVVNQAIPLYYQVKPVFKNIKTLGRIGKEFTKMGSVSNKTSSPKDTLTENNQASVTDTKNSSDVPEPKFFI